MVLINNISKSLPFMASQRLMIFHQPLFSFRDEGQGSVKKSKCFLQYYPAYNLKVTRDGLRLDRIKLILILDNLII
jgi:hypothetical protein